jgi:hypothetical protein
MKVLAFKPNPRKPDQGFVRLTEMVDVQTVDGHKEQVEGEIIEAWTPEVAKVAELVGKELPDGWTLRDGPKGKQLLPPGEKRGGQSYRNTKEAFDAEQDSIWRSVALQQAIALTAQLPYDGRMEVRLKQRMDDVLPFADQMYAWLRKGVSLGVGQSRETVSPATKPSAPPGATSVSGGPPPKASTSAAGVSPPQGDAQGSPSDTSSAPRAQVADGTDATAAKGADTIRREGDAGDSAVEADTPGSPGAVTPQAVQTPGSPSRRQRCLHTEGIKTITKETGGSVDVCEKCGVVVNT